jgi:hypothetical protein
VPHGTNVIALETLIFLVLQCFTSIPVYGARKSPRSLTMIMPCASSFGFSDSEWPRDHTCVSEDKQNDSFFFNKKKEEKKSMDPVTEHSCERFYITHHAQN